MSPTPHDNTVSGAEALARPSGQALVSDQAPTGLAPSGFDPSRGGGAMHTLGPWVADLHRTRINGGRTYATIWQSGNAVPIGAITLGVEGMPDDEGRANARLIAAAPELLAELIELRRRFHSACAAVGSDPEFVALSTPGADAAISKAVQS